MTSKQSSMSIPGIPDDFFVVKKTGLSQAQALSAYLGGSAFQTVMDNPVTAYRQLVQQYAKDAAGKPVDPKIASQEAKAVFRAHPVSASLSGVGPRLIGVGFKRIPKFGILLGFSFFLGEGENPGFAAATAASILSAPFINPIRMIEKQQRAFFKQTGHTKPILEIMREAAAQRFAPLFRGTIPLMGHSLASALLGLVGQPRLQKYIQKELGDKTSLGRAATGLVASSIVSPIYVVVTNPLSRLEVIMQTSAIAGKPYTVVGAVKEMAADMAAFGMRGVFRGQGIGIAKAVISLTLFHEGRHALQDAFKNHNVANGYLPEE
ncbi:predicted protein [Phaeodactylum tricornutum CCAP 1055/1]|jgi:hypothetical protein|uniref:Mitochondrial carrier protein n=2 Tax=Phaeodactylum tricornutum TaxID=2850 RepID=B7FVA7_PHATC|nr:predicted protein [Phaeodactylum tricornutum CCAP 1055/1]EEC49591.1 predicted protein [Phaeodactylum tricornutum CCAP 1055/1]|eukprot:XP_002178893.1 predicted protein [Phaeodactylum tricornutum CCAP 1055/1]